MISVVIAWVLLSVLFTLAFLRAAVARPRRYSAPKANAVKDDRFDTRPRESNFSSAAEPLPVTTVDG